jgi:hypothetical protein
LDRAQIHVNLAEAASFLAKMIEQERQLIGEPFTHYLSAFLTAGMSVRDGFHCLDDRPRNEKIKAWRENWEKSLTLDDQCLYDWMRELRDAAVHIGNKSRRTQRNKRRSSKAGTELIVGQEEIKVGVGSSYSDRSGTVQAFGDQACFIAWIPMWSFTSKPTASQLTATSGRSQRSAPSI